MLYQKLLMGERPYYINVGRMRPFEEHRHSEIELIFCLKGFFDIVIDQERHRIHEGEFAFVGSMKSHEVPEEGEDTHLIIEVGSVLLSEYFSVLSEKSPDRPVFSFREHAYLSSVVAETAELNRNPREFSELFLRGNIFRICACVLEKLVSENTESHTSKALRSVANIEKALDMIRMQYAEKLTVEQVAASCGYSKSNFCKIFKNITEDTFHGVLNKQRVKVAKALLSETDLSAEQIAVQTGFADSKSLCRVFKQLVGESPGKYRKSGKSDKKIQ